MLPQAIRRPNAGRLQEDFAQSRDTEGATAVDTVEPETGEPREARKGWWQRRFKI